MATILLCGKSNVRGRLMRWNINTKGKKNFKGNFVWLTSCSFYPGQRGQALLMSFKACSVLIVFSHISSCSSAFSQLIVAYLTWIQLNCPPMSTRARAKQFHLFWYFNNSLLCIVSSALKQRRWAYGNCALKRWKPLTHHFTAANASGRRRKA